MTRVTIEVSEEQKRRIKVMASMSNLSLKDLILERTIGRAPNKETLKSFEDYEKKQKLTEHHSFDKLMEDLNK